MTRTMERTGLERVDLSESHRSLAQSVHSAIAVGMDLAFQNPQLEQEYIEEHNSSQIFYDIALAIGIRLIGWIGSGFKALQRGERSNFFWMLFLCLPSGLLPLCGLIHPRRYLKNRRYWVMAANLSQFIVVGHFYQQLYPCTGMNCDETKVPLSRALMSVLASNGTAFLILTTFVGSLVHRWLLIAQYTYFLVLVGYNRSICAESAALRRGYAFLEKTFNLRTRLGFENPSSTNDTCVALQLITQLIFGLWVPLALAFSKEIQSRKSFLARRLGRTIADIAAFPSLWENLIYLSPAFGFPLLISMLAVPGF